ncbi:MAG: class I SAM-dependent methyltransferase, partial [Eudoraea sp.]|nr:class I SAM-dependent methyltransferase [Eudoraea sp.]
MTKNEITEPSSKQFTVVDHAVSGETFELRKHPIWDMWVTHPVPENLEKYYQSDDYISHTDSRNTFFDRIYQATKAFRLKRKVRMLEKLLGNRGKLLDIGAGTGDLVKQAISMGWQAEGVEPNTTAREKAQKKGIALKENGKAFPKKAFDVITLWHVLEHLPQLEDSIQQI